MKKIFAITITMIIIAVAINGCTKEADKPISELKATINGAKFDQDDCSTIVSGGALVISAGTYAGSTHALGYPNINITIANYTGAGTYIISDTVIASVDSSATYSAIATYGIVTITESATRIAGTFSFTCSDSTKVANGSFYGDEL